MSTDAILNQSEPNVILTAHSTKVNRTEPNRTEPQTCLACRNHAFNTDWNSEIKNYLELTMIGVCKTVLIFARFDCYYVNRTFSKIWHFGKIDLWFDLIWTKNDSDLIWLFVIRFLIWGFDLNHFCKWFVICRPIVIWFVICPSLTHTNLGDRTFCAAGLRVWNNLSTDLRQPHFTGQFIWAVG